jgi:endonuclease-3
MDVPRLLDRLKSAYPVSHTALRHENPLELLVATILSAQCTDERVNQVTPRLFQRWPDVSSLAAATQEDVEEVVRSTGFYRNKAKAIRGAARRILEAHEGQVPRTMEGLLTLPGVARKTANVVMGSAYGIAAGIVVDTHVERIAHRLGLSAAKTPEKVEEDLIRQLPREEWIDFSHRLIDHGRRICLARAPRCGECPVQDLCPSAALFLQGLKPTTRRDRTAGGRRARLAVARRAPRSRENVAAGQERAAPGRKSAGGRTSAGGQGKAAAPRRKGAAQRKGPPGRTRATASRRGRTRTAKGR